MLNIVCINAGNYLGRGTDYVNILANMVARNISKEVSYKFICFTDTPGDYDSEIDMRPLPVQGLKGWFNKLSLFKEGLFPEGDRILYIDLDTIITGGLDDIIKYSGKFAILRDFYRPDNLQSSVMAWESGFGNKIWQAYEVNDYPIIDGGDQEWIERYIKLMLIKPVILQDIFPERFVSYKMNATQGIPKNAKMVIFHGIPRPHEIDSGWMPYVWKIDGGTTMELEHICNTNESQITAHIKSAMKSPYPWLRMMPPHDGHAVIVGGGPSLKGDLGEITARQKHGQVIFSTNNTSKFLYDNGITPEVHLMLDARHENIEFIPDYSDKMQFYYASQVHPDCIKKAAEIGNMVLWHPMIDGILETIGNDTGDALVGGGTTIGMKAIAVAFILGYRNFHLYGFDSSYSAGENHCYKQPLNNNEKIIEVVMNEKKYSVAPWMTVQLDDFKETVKALINSGCTITVHGFGLIPDAARLIEVSVPMVNIRASEILSRLNVSDPVGAEIGVFAGGLSSRLLDRPDLTLYMIDSWTASDNDSEYTKSGDYHANLTQDQQEKYYESTKRTVSFGGERAKIIRKSSVDAAKDIPDGSLDFVFIDADHSYEGCKADILAWKPKLKPGGLLSGHDYKNSEYPCFGVDRAVDEFSKESGLPMELGQNYTWFIRLTA